MKKVALFLISFYRKNKRLVKPKTCRYYPTCSDYTYQAINKYGIIKGGFLGLWRILRCNPFSKGGIDLLK
ncbi:MAG: membrane protein insertion efficiency factor YidD [Clostridia bacterium]|jgi:putative membrane protein insertion efficiency factor|nr:membrane protein insertion efficiency factor YidD [Clostridia bacterium]